MYIFIHYIFSRINLNNKWSNAFKNYSGLKIINATGLYEYGNIYLPNLNKITGDNIFGACTSL